MAAEAAVAAKHCWDKRGCDGLPGLTGLQADECPHARTDCYSPCPADCNFTACFRPTHKVATDLNLILDPTVDFSAPMKVACRYCEFFLKHGPRLGEDGPMHELPNKASSDGSNQSTMHFF